MKVINKTKNIILADKARIAKSFFARLTGLLNRPGLGPGEALVIIPSNSVHSFFMRFTIDVIFLDKNNAVVRLYPFFKPFLLSPMYLKAHSTVELPEGVIQSSKTSIGDQLEIQD